MSACSKLDSDFVTISDIFPLLSGVVSLFLLFDVWVPLPPEAAGEGGRRGCRGTRVDCWGKKGFGEKQKKELTASQKGRRYLLTVSE